MPITYDALKKEKYLDCSKITDLRGRYFHNRIITNYDNTDFSGCVLYHCFPRGIPNAIEINPVKSEEDVPFLLQGSNLRGANLAKAKLKGANFSRAMMGPTEDDHEESYIVLLNEADLRKVDFSNANLNEAELEGANLKFANLSGASAMLTNFNHANLAGANLQRANLYAANLENANLKGADLRFSIIQSANMNGALYDTKTRFENALITEEQLDSMVFVEDED